MRKKRPWWMDEVHPEDSEETPAARVAGVTTEYEPPKWVKGMTPGQLAGHREEMRRLLREQREKVLGGDG